MTVGELVRSIGGARDVPIRKCDVVEDRTEREQKKAQEKEDGSSSADQPITEEDTQADEFYASLGMEKQKKKGDNESEEEDNQKNEDIVQQQEQLQPPSNLTDGVRDFYKTYTQYYYSKDPNPFSDQRLEFGLPIAAGDENSNSNDGTPVGGEQTIIQLARMAQIRARQAAAAADALDKAKKAKAINTVPLGPGDVVENEAEIYDPLPMEVIPSTVAEDLGITVDTTLEQYWEFVKNDPHDFNRWIYLIHYSESKVSKDRVMIHLRCVIELGIVFKLCLIFVLVYRITLRAVERFIVPSFLCSRIVLDIGRDMLKWRSDLTITEGKEISVWHFISKGKLNLCFLAEL